METEKEESKFLNPEEIVGKLEINAGSFIADFGCGSGYFSVALAKKAGSEGKVFALDIMPQALESVAGRAEISGLDNIIARRVNLEKEGGSNLDTASLDWVIIKDVLFQNQDKKIILREARRVLKPEGKILIVEWNQEFQGVGPVAELRIGKKDLQKISEEEKFIFMEEIQAGKFHYALVFKK